LGAGRLAAMEPIGAPLLVCDPLDKLVDGVGESVLKHRRSRHMSHALSLSRLARTLLFAMLAGLLLSGCGINNIPTYDENAKAKWSDVQNQYQRRADLIPNLVETVKGYAAQERQVLTQVTEARAKVSQIKVDASTITDPTKFKEYQDAQNALTGALGRLLVTVERYPDLKSNQNFLALQSQLEGTENRISVARRDYIEGVRVYNTELKTFPGRLWASTLYHSYKPMETFTVAEELQKPPAVKF
jgi:LemA protein